MKIYVICIILFFPYSFFFIVGRAIENVGRRGNDDLALMSPFGGFGGLFGGMFDHMVYFSLLALYFRNVMVQNFIKSNSHSVIRFAVFVN